MVVPLPDAVLAGFAPESGLEFPSPEVAALLRGALREVFSGGLFDLAEVADGDDEDSDEDLLGGVAVHSPSGTVANGLVCEDRHPAFITEARSRRGGTGV